MTRSTITQTCRKGVERSVVVERAERKRAVDIELCRRRLLANEAARDPLREIGCAIVAAALGDHAAGVGGVMTGDRVREIDRKGASKPVAKIDMGPPPIVIPAPGLLAADISRLIRPERQRQFPTELWLGGTL